MMSSEPPDSTSEKNTQHPYDELLKIANGLGVKIEDLQFAQHMDKNDPLRHLRNDFHYPKMKTIQAVDPSLVDQEEDCVYFCGNSLGLCPKNTKKYMDIELDKWANTGVDGHFNGDLPWAWCDEVLDGDMAKLVGNKKVVQNGLSEIILQDVRSIAANKAPICHLGVQGHTHGDIPWQWCDELLDQDMAKIVGAKDGEVAIMNGLTVNLHLLLVSFYRPTPERHKIMFEGKAFPSDHYAFESQIKFHGFDPETSMVCMEPRKGEHTLRTEDILAKIEEEGDSIALVCFSGVQYYTGQLYEMEKITKAGQAKGCYVGWDLAHAAGNVELFLHDWGVDFACWCTYKYINTGAGGLACIFLHEKHFNNNFPKLAGWWGHKYKTRFKMDNKFDPYPGAYGYRLSNTPGLLCPSLKASLEIFNKTSMSELCKKQRLLTGYLEALIKRKYGYEENGCENSNGNSSKEHDSGVHVQILTPSDPSHRGAQLSLSFSINITQVFEELQKRGVVCDERKPSVIRIAPCPLYCSFEDVHRFMKYLDQALHAAKAVTD